jgi:hypothetical protein
MANFRYKYLPPTIRAYGNWGSIDHYAYGGINKDILDLLIRLPRDRKIAFLDHYRSAYGEGAAKYADNTLSSWSQGWVRQSENTRLRLIRIAPKVLSPQERLEIVSKLHDAYRKDISEKHHFTVYIGMDKDYEDKLNQVMDSLCQKPGSVELPDRIRKRIDWLCNDDSVLCRKLLSEVETQQSFLLAEAAKIEIQNILQKLKNSSNDIVGHHKITFPYGTIEIDIRNPSLLKKLFSIF